MNRKNKFTLVGAKPHLFATHLLGPLSRKQLPSQAAHDCSPLSTANRTSLRKLWIFDQVFKNAGFIWNRQEIAMPEMGGNPSWSWLVAMYWRRMADTNGLIRIIITCLWTLLWLWNLWSLGILGFLSMYLINYNKTKNHSQWKGFKIGFFKIREPNFFPCPCCNHGETLL